MDLTAANLLEIWDLFSDFVTNSKKPDIAIKFIKILVDQDVDFDVLNELRGDDEYLDDAIDMLDGSSTVESYDDDDDS
jgi:hypothetical protein